MDTDVGVDPITGILLLVGMVGLLGVFLFIPPALIAWLIGRQHQQGEVYVSDGDYLLLDPELPESATDLEQYLAALRQGIPDALTDAREAVRSTTDPVIAARAAADLAGREVRVLRALPDAWSAYAQRTGTPEFAAAVEAALHRLRAGGAL